MSHTAHANPRETILTRIREAHRRAPIAQTRPGPLNGGSEALPISHTGADERLAAFSARMEQLGVSCVLCDNRADVAEGLALFSKRSGWRSVSALQSPFLLELLKGYQGGVIWTGADCDPLRLASVDVAILEADALDSQFGAILCGSAPGGLELVSLAPALVVVAPFSRLYSSLGAAWDAMAGRNGGRLPAGFTQLAGAAANQAIERRRIARGHGPQSITVFLAPD